MKAFHRVAVISSAVYLWASIGISVPSTRAQSLQDRLFDAVENGRKEEVVSLLNMADGPAVDARDSGGRTPLIAAAWFGQTDVARILLERKADIEAKDNDGHTALMEAALVGKKDAVEFLLKNEMKPASADALDSHGETALMLAAGAGSANCVELLLDAGAKVVLKDYDGRTALMWAALGGNAESLNLILSRGADIEARDSRGQTALILASLENSTATADILLSCGANTEDKDKEGRTALMWAALGSSTQTVVVLMNGGADAGAKDISGKKAVDLTQSPTIKGLLGAAPKSGGHRAACPLKREGPQPFRKSGMLAPPSSGDGFAARSDDGGARPASRESWSGKILAAASFVVILGIVSVWLKRSRGAKREASPVIG